MPELVASDWKERLAAITEMMRELSLKTDPQEMVKAYGERTQKLMPIDRRLSLSRRGLRYPQFRITRDTAWQEEVNPWKQPEKLPLLSGGLLADLIYGNEPRLVDELVVADDDPARDRLSPYRSLLAFPMFDMGEAINMVISLRTEPYGFDPEQFPDLMWRANLFGRATGNLVLKDELARAYKQLDRELKVVGEIQRSLLPEKLPKVPTLDLASHYQPAARAGGDYYDFFALPDGKWGIFIADVSGHGTPAAVLMAVTHCIAHTLPGPASPPGKVLAHLNRHLTEVYASLAGTFVTAFYAVYDPKTLRLTYANAGHNSPRVKRCADGSLHELDAVGEPPLGVVSGMAFEEATEQLQEGDQLIFYTDGITEAHNPAGELFGVARLDMELENCALAAQGLLDSLLDSVEQFSAGRPADDDRTIIVARVVPQTSR